MPSSHDKMEIKPGPRSLEAISVNVSIKQCRAQEESLRLASELPDHLSLHSFVFRIYSVVMERFPAIHPKLT